MAQRYIADLHFGDKTFLKNCCGMTVEDHAKMVIEKWNNIVLGYDEIVLIGDIGSTDFQFTLNCLKQLNGQFQIIGGLGHTNGQLQLFSQYLKIPIIGILESKGYIFSHIPLHESQITTYKGNIHGYTHTQLINNQKYYNICAENINFTPLTLSEIENRQKSIWSDE